MRSPTPAAAPRLVIVLTAVLAAALVAGVLVVRLIAVPASGPVRPTAQDTGRYSLVPVQAPQARSRACDTLLAALPDTLVNGKATLHRRPLAKPAPPGAAAWGSGDHPVVLRCGLPRPEQLTPTSTLVQVSGVQWLEITNRTAGAVTGYVVDRPVYVALTTSTDAGTGPIQGISAAVARALPAVKVRPAG